MASFTLTIDENVYYILFTIIFALLIRYAILSLIKRNQNSKKNAPRWKISKHIGVLSTSSKSIKKQEKENIYTGSSNNQYNNNVNSNLVDKYATPWNNVPLGMKDGNVYEPNTGELFRRLDSSFKRVANNTRTPNSSRRQPSGIHRRSTGRFVATPRSMDYHF